MTDPKNSDAWPLSQTYTTVPLSHLYPPHEGMRIRLTISYVRFGVSFRDTNGTQALTCCTMWLLEVSVPHLCFSVFKCVLKRVHVQLGTRFSQISV